MQLTVETLLDGVMRTLREAVLPAVGERFARGQLFAVLDVLQNLRDRVEPKAELAELEAISAAAALERAARALPSPEQAELTRALAEAPAGPPTVRAAALRAILVRAYGLLDGLPDERGAAARSALAEHLAAQTMRDVAVLKPSLLEEISKG
jgi:hypothetical protein